MGSSEEVGFPWRMLFPIKDRPHYDIEVPNDVAPDLLPFFHVLIGVPIIVLCCTQLWWARYNDHVQDGTSFFAKLWREFGKCDTRWWSEDEVIFALEFMAGYFCGPTALITIIGYLLDKPWRYVTQAICVTAQAYGLIITWVPAYFSGLVHVPTWSWSLYYGYFWLMQSPWLFMPFILCLHSCYNINKYFEAYDKLQQEKDQKEE